MIKSVTAALLGMFILSGVQGQETSNLNGFKYVTVETLFYKDDQVDIHGISVMIRLRLMDMGLTVVAENKESWPDELLANECLLLICRITAKDRIIGRQKLEIEGYDCNLRKAIALVGYGNAETYSESYQIALDDAFEVFEDNKYTFDPSLTPHVQMRAVEKTILDVQEAREYLKASTNLDPIEGIYQPNQEGDIQEIVIRREEDLIKAIVLQSAGEIWAQGEVIGYFVKSTIPNVYEVRWSDKRTEEQQTIAFIGGEGDLSIEVNHNGTKVKLDYRKTFPQK